MKKYLIILALLVILPVKAYAGTITTSYDTDRCALIVSGTNTGHDATISVFNKNEDLIGFKTGEIKNNNYLVEFIYTFDQEQLIDITLSSEAGGSETQKKDVNIPACELKSSAITELVDDPSGVSVVIKDDTVGFNPGDHLVVEVMDEETLNQFLEQIKGTPEYEGIKSMVDFILKQLGSYREFGTVLNVYIRDDHQQDVDYSSYNGGFIINFKVDPNDADKLDGLKIATFGDDIVLSDPIDYTYDSQKGIISFSATKPGHFVLYVDKDYNYLDNTNDQTYDGSSDGLKFRVNADHDLLVDVMLDGTILGKDLYKDSSGSTIIEFAKSYLDLLTEGKHELRVNFKNGKAITTLTVNKTSYASGNNSSANPKTSDNILIYQIVFVLSAGAILTSLFIKKYRNN